MAIKHILLAGILINSLSGCAWQAAQDSPVVRIANFKGDRPAAISYTFDDGLKDQAELAVPMLNKLGFRATFFIIPSVIPETDRENFKHMTWKQLKEIADNGHEIASHSWAHPDLKTVTDSMLLQEIDKADKLIKSRIGYAPGTFAYPYNSFNAREHDAVMRNHFAARESQFAFGSKFTSETGNGWADKLIKTHQWGVTVIHGIIVGFDAFTGPDVLQEHFNYVKKHEDKIWVSTFANVARYVQERENVELKVTREKNKVIIIANTTLNPKIYIEPLTIVVETGGVVSANASRSKEKYPVTIYKDRISVDCIPGPDPVVIEWRK